MNAASAPRDVGVVAEDRTETDVSTNDVETAPPLASPRLLARHQVAAVLGTAADFATMIGLVELGGLAPPRATILSAIVGGVVNFTLSRGWAFRADHRGSALGQALRYAGASLGGALLNASFLALVLAVGFPVPYPIARAAVAFLVSLLYSYPVHARFVFRLRETRARAMPETSKAPR